MSNNVDLVETSVEGLGCWDVVNVTNTEDILVFFMLEGSSVDIKEAAGFLSSQAGFDETVVWSSWDQGVELAVGTGFLLAGF